MVEEDMFPFWEDKEFKKDIKELELFLQLNKIYLVS